MSEENFTKGPWVVRLSDNATPHVMHKNGDDYTDCGDHSSIVCGMPAEIVDDYNSLANARLIAAAPELYGACTPLAQILERAVEEGAANLTLMITREMAEEILLARSKARGEL